MNRALQEEKMDELLPDAWDFNQIVINEQRDSLTMGFVSMGDKKHADRQRPRSERSECSMSMASSWHQLPVGDFLGTGRVKGNLCSHLSEFDRSQNCC